jgi:hypothetical protein
MRVPRAPLLPPKAPKNQCSCLLALSLMLPLLCSSPMISIALWGTLVTSHIRHFSTLPNPPVLLLPNHQLSTSTIAACPGYLTYIHRLLCGYHIDATEQLSDPTKATPAGERDTRATSVLLAHEVVVGHDSLQRWPPYLKSKA